MGGPSDGSNDTSIAMSAASRVATARARAGGVGVAKKRSGSLALTALAVIAALIGMLVLMLKFGS